MMIFVKLTKKVLLSFSVASALSVSVQAADAIKTYDLLVLYEASMANSRYGKDLDARFAYLEDYTNQTLKNSRVNSKVRVVHSAPAPSGFTQLEYAQLGQARVNDTIAKLRKKHGADFVVLMGDSRSFCGLGYKPTGNPDTGQLYSNARNYAYNLVDFNCGGGTFAHELGHNMSLGHSVKQGSKGGVWPWAVGHGQSGRWVSTMSYGSAYSTGNRLQYYSNPRINECEGDSCGISNRADSSKNLNLLASQHVDFMPEVYSTSGGSTGGNTGGSTTVCVKPALANNLLKNGDFNSLSSWKSFYIHDVFETVAENRMCGIDNLLHTATKAPRSFGFGFHQDVTSVIKPGVDYQFSMKAKLDANLRKDLRVYLQIRANNKYSFQKIVNSSITGNDYTTLKGNFVFNSVKNIQEIKLVIYSVEGKGALIDEVLLTKSNSGTTTTTKPVLDDNFNNGLQGWKTAFNAKVLPDVNGGVDKKGGMRISQRTRWYQGAKKDVKGLLSSDTIYQLEADIFVEGNGNAALKPYLYRRMAGERKTWIRLGNAQVASGSWQKVSMEIRVPKVDNASILDLYMMGPKARVNFKMDNIRITKK